MHWGLRKKTKGAKEEPSDSGPVATPSGDPMAAVDAVARLLRTFGRHAFDTDEREATDALQRCEQWASQIVVGQTRQVEGAVARGPETLQRDWNALGHFFSEMRRGESEYVERSLGSLRTAVLCFAGCLSKAVEEEKRSDAEVSEQLELLSQVVEARDPDRVIHEARRVVETVRGAIVARRKREVEQVWALGERVRELRAQLCEARRLAEVDGLTQLMNRASFDQYLEHLAALGLLLGQPPWLLMADLDHFKSINDVHGHPAGDQVLREVSQCFARTFLRKQDFVCRYGGEEFAVLLIDTTPEQMIQLAERLSQAVRGLEVSHGEQTLSVTVSIGLACLEPGETGPIWLERADRALYQAKSTGRDRVAISPSDATEV